MLIFGDDLFQPPRQRTAWQQNAPPAPQAFQTDIGAQAHDFPFITAAWVGFAKLRNIIQVQLWQHGEDYTLSVRYTAG
jgi:hypothetical protein